MEAYSLYSNAGKYADAIVYVQSALNCVSEIKNEAEYINASIILAELYRKTHDWQKGITILKELENTIHYPKLHARKLARLAGLYYEYWPNNKELQRDTIHALLTEGLEIAVQYKYPHIEADFRNQLGMLQCRDGNLHVGISNFKKSAKLFNQQGDFENEAIALGHEFELYSAMVELDTANALLPPLLKKIKNKDWYATKIDIYSMVARHYIFLNNDSLNYLKFTLLAKEAHLENLKKTHSNQMSFHRVIEETDAANEKALKNERIAKEKNIALKSEKSKIKQLIVVIGFFVILFLGIVIFIIRENRLKKTVKKTVEKLNAANTDYEMLLIESNHRIKNNLQMILSMIEMKTLKSGAKSEDLEKISGNVQAISTLHKYLSFDIHNQEVDLIQYLQEIVTLYAEVEPKNFEVKTSLKSLKIPSERIVYFGLIFNEMLSNTIEHSFEKTTKITLGINQCSDNLFSFTYTDGSCWDKSNNKGLGITLITGLVKRINGQSFKLNSDNGTYYFKFDV
jgi:two-component sensor histidine kinase